MKRIFVFFFILLLVSSTCYSQFKYENPVWVKNNTSTALTNIQVLIKVNTEALISAGWMQTTGNDIRFVSTCNGSSFLGHWVEGYLNTDSTKIWVNVPAIAASDSTLIYMYYGNAAASNIGTLSVFYGPHSATDSVIVSSTTSSSNSQRGFRFTANEDLLVAYFGKRIPNATQRYVTLFDFTTQAVIAQIQVDAGTASAYNYNLLTTPLWLRATQQYLLELYQGSGDNYYWGTSSQVGQHLTYGDMRYCNSCTQNTFPTTFLSNYQYGCPDFLYYTKQNVTPAPTCRVLAPADTLAPSAPTGLTATPGNGTALLKWNKNTQFDIYQYNCYKNTTNNPTTSTYLGTVNHPDSTYTATGLTPGTYYFWVKAVDKYCIAKTSDYSTAATAVVTDINVIGSSIPDKYYLSQNYPNPFNPVTKINFGLKKNDAVEMKVFDLAGKEVVTLLNSHLNAGNYSIEFNGQNLASGIYIYRIITKYFTEVKKMVLIK